MKKLLWILVALISVFIFTGCQSNQTKLVYESFSDEEEELFSLTGNRIRMYEMKNLPSDKKYEISLTYEVYENKEKVKDEMIFAARYDETGEKEEDYSLNLNYQDNKIRVLFNKGTYSYHDLEEDLSNYSRSILSRTVNIELGKSYYIYYATSHDELNASDYVVGTPVTTELTNELLEDNASTIFVKLSFNSSYSK